MNLQDDYTVMCNDINFGGKKMNKSKKVIVTILAVLLSLSSLTACAGAKPPATPAATAAPSAPAPGTPDTTAPAGDKVIDASLTGEITQWVWGDYEIRGAARFNEYYPNIKVNYVTVPNDEYEKKVLTTLQSGAEMPDVINIESAARGQMINMDVWERLDAAPYNMKMDDMLDFSKPLVTNKKGEVTCVQVDNCVGGYAYDRNLTKKYFGTDDPAELEKMFSNLDAFAEKGKEVAGKSGGKDFMFAGVDDVYDAVCPLNAANEPFVKDKKLNMDNSILPTYQFIEKMVANKAVGNYIAWTPAWNTSFASNNVVFCQAPTWYVSFVIKENDPDSMGKWGLISPPGGGFSNGGTAYAIPKAAKEENKILAWTYINWLTMSQEGAECFYEAHATPTLYEPAYSTNLYEGESDPYFAGENLTKKYMEISQNPKTMARPVSEYDLTIKDANTQAMRNLEAGMSAQDAYEKMKADVIAKAPELS